MVLNERKMISWYPQEIFYGFIAVIDFGGVRMELFLFRLSLKAKEMVDLFEVRAPDGSLLSREGWLRLYFSQEQEFWVVSQFEISPS